MKMTQGVLLVLRALPLKRSFGSFGPFETAGQSLEGPERRSFEVLRTEHGEPGAVRRTVTSPRFGWLFASGH